MVSHQVSAKAANFATSAASTLGDDDEEEEEEEDDADEEENALSSFACSFLSSCPAGGHELTPVAVV